MAKGVEGHSVSELVESNSRWLGAFVLEETASELAKRIIGVSVHGSRVNGP